MSSSVGRRTSSPSSSIPRSSAQPVIRLRSATAAVVLQTSTPSGRGAKLSSPGTCSGPTPVRQAEADLGRALIALPKLVRASLGDDLTRGDDRDPVGEPLRLVHVVRGQEDGLAEVAQAGDHVPGLAARRGVESRGRLVEEQQVGIADQRHADVEAAQLATREPTRTSIRLLCESDVGDRRPTPPAARCSSRRRARASRAPSAPGASGTAASTIPIRSRHSRSALPGSWPSTATAPADRSR